jgi:outer membrane autotransporter protein
VAGIDAGDAAGSWRLGAFYAHTDNTYRVSARTGSRAEADTSYFGLYGMARLGDFRLSGGAALLTGSQDTTRGAETLLGLSGAMRGSYDLDGAQAFMEAAYAMRIGRFAVEPFAGLAWTRVGAGRVAETGVAASNLTGAARSAEQVWSTLGLRVETSLTLGGGMVLTPRAEIGWQHAYGRTAPLTTLAFASGGNPFTIAGAPMARDAIVGELGADLRITENLRGMVSYLGATGSGVDQHAIRLGLALTF